MAGYFLFYQNLSKGQRPNDIYVKK